MSAVIERGPEVVILAVQKYCACGAKLVGRDTAEKVDAALLAWDGVHCGDGHEPASASDCAFERFEADRTRFTGRQLGKPWDVAAEDEKDDERALEGTGLFLTMPPQREKLPRRAPHDSDALAERYALLGGVQVWEPSFDGEGREG